MKFKIWNKKTKRFIQNDKDVENRKGYYLGQYAVSSIGQCLFFQSEEGGMNMIEVDNVVILQHISEDSDGNDIYDGDIVQSEDGIWQVQLLGVENGVSLVNDNQMKGSTSFFRGAYSLRETKNIGNIYQNPELLK